jgi:hypothetical protein
MITNERLLEIFETQACHTIKGMDYKATAITLLRSRIPYDTCKCILHAAEHDIVYLCDVEDALPYLSEEDAHMLAICNVGIDEEFESFYIFV